MNRPLRRDWPARHLASTYIPNTAAFQAEAIDTNSILPSTGRMMNMCLRYGKAAFDYLRAVLAGAKRG
jgi:hypothetical protein